MEDDGPVEDACKMPSFISSFEDGRARLSGKRPTRTSLADDKVERPVRDLNRRVSGSDRGDTEPPEEGEEERSNSSGSSSSSGGGGSEEEEEEEKDAESNNNNNCNGGGGAGEKRRTSAVEILRRNFGVVKSHSLRFNTGGRMRCGAEHERCKTEVLEGETSDRETGAAGIKNEPTSVELTSRAAHAVKCHYLCASDANNADSEESPGVKEHVYCTVYCIANDPQTRRDSDTTSGYDDCVTPNELDLDVESGQLGGSSPEPPLYTLDDLVDPFGDIVHQLYREQDGVGSAAQSCRVCLEDKVIAPVSCCRKAVCDECLKLYVSLQVRAGRPHIFCPIPECSGYLEERVVISHLANEDVAKYRYFLELNKLDSSTKPCPQCSQFTSLKKHSSQHSEHKYKIQCINCQFVWCFKCHAPWHNGLKCREYRKGDKLLRSWANVIEHGQRNAQKCPQCRIHIQRIEGCDHMTCTQCNTNFCYRCGERYRHLRFFGDHTSNLSVFGCKFRYLPDKPHLRRLIRGSVCATKLLIAPVVIVLVVALLAVSLVIGLVVFPPYYVCKRRKKQRTHGSVRWI